MRLIAGTGMGRSPLQAMPLRMPLGGRSMGLSLGTPRPIASAPPAGPALGEGRLSQAPITDAARAALERRIGAILRAVEAEYQKILEEAGLALDETRYREIAIVGPLMTQPEALGQVASDADALGHVIEEIADGPGAPYVTREARRELDRLAVALEEIRANANAAGGTFPGAANAGPAAQHTETHVGPVRTMGETLARAVVEAEAGAVPVEEPARIPWLWIGAGAAGLVVIAALLGGD